jgi:hypothetical protein
MGTRDVVAKAGYGRSDEQSFTIPDGADGSAVDAVDLGRNYAFIIVKCEDAGGIPATTGVTAKVGYGDSDTLCDLYEQDDPSTQWSKSALPTTGTLAFLMNHAFGAQRIQFVLSQNASGADVVFKVYGLDSGIDA